MPEQQKYFGPPRLPTHAEHEGDGDGDGLATWLRTQREEHPMPAILKEAYAQARNALMQSGSGIPPLPVEAYNCAANQYAAKETNVACSRLLQAPPPPPPHSSSSSPQSTSTWQRGDHVLVKQEGSTLQLEGKIRYVNETRGTCTIKYDDNDMPVPNGGCAGGQLGAHNDMEHQRQKGLVMAQLVIGITLSRHDDYRELRFIDPDNGKHPLCTESGTAYAFWDSVSSEWKHESVGRRRGQKGTIYSLTYRFPPCMVEEVVTRAVDTNANTNARTNTRKRKRVDADG